MAKISGVPGSGGRRISAFLGVGDWGNFIIPGSCDRRISVVQGFGDWGNFIIPGSCDRRISVVQGFGDWKTFIIPGSCDQGGMEVYVIGAVYMVAVGLMALNWLGTSL